MDITIVNPLSGVASKPQVFMSLLYLATALDKKGHKVTVIDSQIDDPIKSLDKVIDKTDCVALSVMTTQVKDAVEISDYIKKKRADLPVIWGGFHPTLFPVQTVQDNVVDYAIIGEGEKAFLEFLEFLQDNRKAEDVAGLVYKKDGKVTVNPEKPFMDLNELSPPNWDLIKMDRYVTDYVISGVNFGPHLPLHSGRGCPYRCTFCINTVLKTRKWRPITANNIINELKILKKRYNIKYVKFVDENFFMDRKRLKEFCEGIIKEGIDIKWHATCRANYLRYNHIDDELLGLVKKSGCAVIAMGIESGSQKVLDLIQKDIKVEDAIRAVKRCEEMDIIPVCSFMIGLPGESNEDMIKTLNLISELKKICPRTVVLGPQTFRPYPGCDLYNQVKGMLKEPKTLREWTKTEILFGFYTPRHLPWVKDPSYLVNLCFYMRLAESSTNFVGEIMKLPFKKMADFRIKHGFMGFPVDKVVYARAKQIYFDLRNR